MLRRVLAVCVVGVLVAGAVSVSPFRVAFSKVVPAPLPLPQVTGIVVWAENPPPPAANLPLAGQPDCKVPVPDESIVVDPDSRGLRDAFVWLEPAPGKTFEIPDALRKPALPNVEIDQIDCRYVPRVVALREGQTLTVKNSSNVAHNVKWQGNPEVNPPFGKLQPPGPSLVIDGLKADRLPIVLECNIHPWMQGYVRVFDHPYFAVTDAAGKFSIPAPAAGPCILKIWHGGRGWLGGAAGRAGKAINATGAAQDLGKFAF
jgi:hypothetical protein